MLLINSLVPKNVNLKPPHSNNTQDYILVTIAMSKTIIFGPTGHVGSATARAAQQHGAKVFLAMRNPEKRIPHLSVEQEQAAGFERIQADLTKPDTIRAAVTKTGAKHAFIYTVFSTADNMRSSIEALKSAGIS